MSGDTAPVPTGGGGHPRPSLPVGRRITRQEAHRRGRRRRTIPRLVALALTAVAVVLLWPATWGGIFGLTIVNGNSMMPTLSSGDLVVTMRQPSYGVGDVVSYVVPRGQAGAGGHVIHRIREIDETGPRPVFVSQGDNNPQPDPWRFGPEDVYGRAVARVPGLAGAVAGFVFPAAVGAVATLAFLAWAWPRRARPGAAPGEHRSAGR